MTKETMDRILDLYDRAMEDPQYMALHQVYAPTQTALADLLCRMSSADRQILEDYLSTSVGLHHRLLEMALQMGDS